MRKSVVNQSEIAFQGLIQGIIADTIAPPPDNPTANVTLAGTLPNFPMTVYAYQQLVLGANPNPNQTDIFKNLTLPAITFQITNTEQIALDCGVYECKMTASIETQTDDEMDTPGQDIHHERVEALRDCLEDVYYLQSVINAPAAGPDPRTVQNYTLSTLVYADETEENTDRRFITHLFYEITACPQDAPI